MIGSFAEGECLRNASLGFYSRQPGAFGSMGLALAGSRGASPYEVSDAAPGSARISPGSLTALADTAPAAGAQASGDGQAPLSSQSQQPENEQDINELANGDTPASTFEQVYLLLKDQFVDAIPSDAPLAHGASSMLLWSLDEPNSRFVESAERQALEDQATGLFRGIGAAFTVRKVTRAGGLLDRQITIVDTLPGSPAEKAGLKTGDVITDINGHWVMSYEPFEEQLSQLKKLAKDPYNLQKAVDAIEKQVDDSLTLSKAQSMLDTMSAVPLKLVVMRPGPTPSAPASTLRLTLDTSAPLQVKDIESRRLNDGNGYIAFNVFTQSTDADFREAVASLGSIKGLVIDLRDCPGGMPDSAVQIAQALAPAGALGQVAVRSAPGNFGDSANSAAAKAAGSSFPTKVQTLDAAFLGLRSPNFSAAGEASPDAPLLPPGLPISVLVNKGTANVAEMLAAFLHDQVGARVVGSSTFGDAMTQTLFPLTDGSAFTLTTGSLKTEKGIGFYKVGLAPEYPLADPGHPDFAGTMDAGLSKAVALLAEGAQKPAGEPLTASTTAAVPGVLVVASLPTPDTVAQTPVAPVLATSSKGQAR